MGTQKQEDNRLCDFCSEAKALLYCRADSAKLCLACDREVHSTNQLFTKHSRCLLCDACDSSPVSIFCCTEKSVLCQNCDWDTHKQNPSSSMLGLHDRRPLEGFTGRPSVSELLGFLGLDDLPKKGLYSGDDDDKDGKFCFENNGGDEEYGFLDLFAWDNPSIVCVDELIASNDSISSHNFQAMGVPPLPKNRNAVCGQHKDEILYQLRELSKSDPESNNSEGCLESFIEFQSVVPARNCLLEDKDTGPGNNEEPTLVPSYEANAFQWCPNAGEITDEVSPSSETNYLVPEKESDVGDSSVQLCGGQEGESHHAVSTENLLRLPKVAVREINSQERDSALSRYKEKKKTRRYDKHIRYESRRVRAESRTRIKGRFAKMAQRGPTTLT